MRPFRSTPRTRAPRLVAGLAYGAMLLAPAALHAQPGRLVGGAARGATAAPSRLPITVARLDAFVAAMRPAIDAAAAEEARGGLAVRRQAARAAYAACIERAEDGAAITTASPALLREYAETERAYEALRRREQALASAEFQSPEQVQPLTDSVTVLRERLVRLRYPAARRCGPEVWPVSASAEAGAGSSAESSAETSAGASARVAPAVPAGMTAVQFGLLRERVAAWLLTEGRAPGYDAAEQQALAARRTALAPLAARFRSEGLVWKTWEDVLHAP